MPTPKKIKCAVKNIIDHGMHVYSVFLTPEKKLPKFSPGQFLHLTLDEYDPSKSWPDSRVFSIAGFSLDNLSLRITYSVKGKYTKRMENELEIGSNVWIKMPYGDFFIDKASDVVLLAGGTGITAFMSFIEKMDDNHNESVLLAYGAKTEKLLIFKESIETVATNNEKLAVHYFLEEEPGTSSNQNMSMKGTVTKGIISISTILPFVRDREKAKYYLSGPPEMITALQNELRNNGIRSEHIYIDAWN